MPKYTVTLERVEYKTARVLVEAGSAAEAEEAAAEAVTDKQWETENAQVSATKIERSDR